ncbi:YbgF trimerization domain-containing protein, partial [Sandarakinorhabdus rubra]|uniref:YbgF trimerization domain-containing protein n=1 Tax=Sandarakinorhabdus rubra TaxID=2672568 RepID=UPI002E2E3084
MTRLLPFLPLVLLLAAPAAGQAVDTGKLDRRVGKLESEMRAVQRKVFPGGDSRFFAPEIGQEAPPAPAPAPAPTTSPITDLSARVDALEGQLRTMTGQVEAMDYRLRQLEDAQRRMKGDVEFRLNALENPGGAQPQAGTPAAAAPAAAASAGATPAPTATAPTAAPAAAA